MKRENTSNKGKPIVSPAHVRGVRWGNQTKHLPENFDELYRQWKNGKLDIESLMEKCDMKRTAFTKHLREYELQSTKKE